MLSEREVLEITERAIGHQALIEKYNFFINQCADPQVRNLLQQHQQILQSHYNTLVNFLQNNQFLAQTNVQTSEYTMVPRG